MAENPLKTAWMWATEDGEMNGMTIDTSHKRLDWFDGIGCACGDSSAVQSYTEYQRKGSPLGELPDDVKAEIDASIGALVAAE